MSAGENDHLDTDITDVAAAAAAGRPQQHQVQFKRNGWIH
jgi:hypothetical protein